ncbi:thiamine phosphate synthase [Thermogymnomonas acidicola]|uniref:thiamine phosphate synthase n=1 Tax=Thermogymnomonas acidicola TaxID=399579 RepID=UPI001396C652|nr:thiamine phosphate synthase [Thermogymnomonas acidicola]
MQHQPREGPGEARVGICGIRGLLPEPPLEARGSLCDKKTITEGLRAVRIPVYAIGGISQTNVKPLLEQGVSGVAVISSVFSSENPKRAVLEYSGILAEYRCDRDPLSWFRRAGQAGP